MKQFAAIVAAWHGSHPSRVVILATGSERAFSRMRHHRARGGLRGRQYRHRAGERELHDAWPGAREG